MRMRVEGNYVVGVGGQVLPYEDSVTAAERAVFCHYEVTCELANGVLPGAAAGRVKLADYTPFSRAHAIERDLGGL